jgi:cytochrome c biogenesis protein CcdA/thiol-disulfide isomerase/thioredoxin
VVLLLGIAFLAGIVTAISPCVLPVLPILFAGGASGGARRRPLAIVAGVVVAFTASLLVVTWLLNELGLPGDLLRDIAIALLFVAAAMLVVPQLALLIERPLARLTRRPSGDLGGGFLLGLSLGLVFVPCGGVIQGYIAAQAASVGDLGARSIGITIAYALGAAVPMLAIAYGGRAAARGLGLFRAHAQAVRAVLGIVVAACAFLIVFHVDRTLQTKIGDYTGALQHAEKSCYTRRQLGYRCRETIRLTDYGPAPDFRDISRWFNTDGEALSLRKLRGKVVLVDFWTYSCINCLRTLPHLKAWWKDYRRAGLAIVGVHTPEFAFEAEPSNVGSAVKQLGVTWPVALDPEYATWKAYQNEYWPAEYLIDKDGRVRNEHFGEGEYGRTERLIRQLLGEPGPAQAELADMTPTERITPETYLGFARTDERYAGLRMVPNQPRRYRLPARLGQNEWAYGGSWTIGDERALSGTDAEIGLHFHARDVYLVMGGHGRVRISVHGRPLGAIRASGISRLYTVLGADRARGKNLLDAQLRLSFSPGISVYSFTFG